MLQRRNILLVVVSAAAALPALAAAPQYHLTAEQVAAAVRGAGVQVTPEKVSLLADVTATVPQPLLKVKSIEPAGSDRAVARVECADSSQCLPFFVALHVGAGTLGSTVLPGAQTSRSSVTLVRPGERAVLLLEGPHVQITLPVICLENGALGQTIRLSSPDRRLFYTAQVASGGLLRGRL
jgi:flagella basal body P-ring formation protein FlgA